MQHADSTCAMKSTYLVSLFMYLSWIALKTWRQVACHASAPAATALRPMQDTLLSVLREISGVNLNLSGTTARLISCVVNCGSAACCARAKSYAQWSCPRIYCCPSSRPGHAPPRLLSMHTCQKHHVATASLVQCYLHKYRTRQAQTTLTFISLLCTCLLPSSLEGMVHDTLPVEEQLAGFRDQPNGLSSPVEFLQFTVD